MQEFMVNAALAGFFLSIIIGPVGSIVIWKRMSYFGDSISHAALLGVAIGLFLDINLIISSIFISLLFSVLLFSLKSKQNNDTLLGIIAHSSLALALLLLSFMKSVRVDLMAYLFGDILLIDNQDLLVLFIIAITGLFWIIRIWDSLILITISRDLAKASAIKVKNIEFQFLLMLSLIVAVSIKIIGVLLITALMIIPAASARSIAKSPKQMAIISSFISMISVILGLTISLFVDLPAGPSIVVTSLFVFLILNLQNKKNSSI